MEMTFTDSFIEYTRRITYPEVTISSEACLKTRLRVIDEVVVVNKSDFPYVVSLGSTPNWLLVDDMERTLECDETASFAIGIDQRFLPPGHVSGRGEICIRKGLVKQHYPFEVDVTVSYVVPVPGIRVERVPGKEHTLHMQVWNAGGGLLQGTYYDRETNTWDTFLLRGRVTGVTAPEDGSVTALEEEPPQAAELEALPVFEREKTFATPHKITGGVVIACDCLNPHFRTREINPRTYFGRKVFANRPFIDFVRVLPARAHMVDVEVLDPLLRAHCSVVLPERLQAYVGYRFESDNIVRFTLAETAHELGNVVDHVVFLGSGGKRHEMPLIVSFAEGTDQAEE